MRMPNSRQISDEQEEIYAEAPMEGTIMIVGPPGTGKTVIAFLRAQALQRRKKIAQVIMHSKVLQKYTANASGSDGEAVKSVTMHSWVNRWWKSNKIQTPAGSLDKIYLNCPFAEKDDAKALGAKWDKIKRKWYVPCTIYKSKPGNFDRWAQDAITDTAPPKLADYVYDWDAMLLASVKQTNLNDWGHLIIDEAQDFPKKMFSFLRFAADKVADGGLTIMADENQRLNEEHNSTIAEIKSALAIPESRFYLLEENFRNTYQIAEVANFFYVGLASGKPKSPKKQGSNPELVKATDLNQQVEYIVKVLSGRAPGEVGVFADNDDLREQLFNKLQYRLRDKYKVQSYTSVEKRKSKYPIEELTFDQAGTLTVINRHSCKGLEFDFVFIPEIQSIDIDGSNLDTFKMNMYVMCSRAREALYMLYSSSTGDEPAILEYLPSKETGLLEYKYV